jgi:hypothetical protein
MLTRITVPKKQAETAFFVEALTNKYNGQRQIQINDTFRNGDDELKYARRGVNIDVIDIPDVLRTVIQLYVRETDSELDDFMNTLSDSTSLK